MTQRALAPLGEVLAHLQTVSHLLDLSQLSAAKVELGVAGTKLSRLIASGDREGRGGVLPAGCEYSRVFIPEPTGGFSCYILEFPGCISQGDNLQEAYDNLQEALELWLEPDPQETP